MSHFETDRFQIFSLILQGFLAYQTCTFQFPYRTLRNIGSPAVSVMETTGDPDSVTKIKRLYWVSDASLDFSVRARC